MQFITSGCLGDLWSKNVILILACDDKVFNKRGVHSFLRMLKHTVVEQPNVDNWGAVAVGYWHFNGTSMALKRHFNSFSTALQQQKEKMKEISRFFYSYWSREFMSPVCEITVIDNSV